MDKQKVKIAFFLITDILFFIFSYFLSFLLRFDFNIPRPYDFINFKIILPVCLIKIVVFVLFNMYKRLWRYASIRDVEYIIAASFVANFCTTAYLFLAVKGFPRSIYLTMLIFDIIFVSVTRIGSRVINDYYALYRRNSAESDECNESNILVVGAGKAGSIVIGEFFLHPELNKKVIAVVDDDISKQGLDIHGINVVGKIADIEKIVKKYSINEIVIATPSASRKEIRVIIDECKKVKCSLKTLPGIYEIVDGAVSIQHIRKVEIEDLLGRDPIKLDMNRISNYIENKTVIVTGGGGSIGSELCRQIVKYRPNTLIIFDIYENNAYGIQNELRKKYPKLNLKVLIGSVRDRKRLEEVFDTYKPQVVFHAAAHKHVPLMEGSPAEAIKNNVFGTLNTAETASKYGAEKFILISTDKAVNPTNIMGASKRICEIIIQGLDKVSKTKFAAVRFGNVLGSNGSVIPLFKKQIAQGGPVTVTHPDIIRYFMTIPEAVQLVLQAGSMARGGEIFVLDMGDPVKIDTLARDLIRLSGFEPDVDMKIIYTGLRPGEKLFEELLMAEEGLRDTQHSKIFVAKPLESDYEEIKDELEILKKSIAGDSCYENVKNSIKKMVPNFIEMGEELKGNEKIV